MTSFNFPRMFNHTKANLIEDKEAVKKNMYLLVSSERDTLFGDPYFGAQLKKYIYEQSNSVIADLIIDEMYTTIRTFIPQVSITRKDITVYSAKNSLFVEIRYRYITDGTSDLFIIRLTDSSHDN